MRTPISDAIKRVFVETFTARDIAEPLASFDAGTAAAEVRNFMDAMDFDIVGIRSEGQVVSYVDRDALANGACGRQVKPLTAAPVLDDSWPLLKLVLELKTAPFVFISLLGSVGGIVTRADLQKPPVRMWLFGLMTLIESRFTQLIERHFPAEEWKKYVSESRLQKANDLLAERQRRNQKLRLLDCLQLADKGQIVARDVQLRQETIFTSRRQVEETTRVLERLRNNLAHSQDIIATDWDTIIVLSEFVMRQFAPGQAAAANVDFTRNPPI